MQNILLNNTHKRKDIIIKICLLISTPNLPDQQQRDLSVTATISDFESVGSSLRSLIVG